MDLKNLDNLETTNFIDEIIKDDLLNGRIKSVITRFPPEPNGYLHIGHAKAILISLGLAQKYNGICNLRFDDTNPVKEEDEFVKAIETDMRWLGWSGDIYYASDYFEQMYACAVRLIKKGLAYVDDLSADEIRSTRGTLTEGGIESKNRNRPIEESLKLFEDMKNGLVEEGALTLRAKIDMKSPNINMRDPIIYRVLKAHHHRQGNKWNIYPMYDFAHPIEDAVEKITHSICTMEFEDHRPLYDWVIEHGEYDPKPHQYEFARLNLTKTIMSKRYLKKLVDDKIVDGWDDPRMPTISGLRRRGYSPKAIKNFCERIGVSKANSEVDKAFLEFCIREELNLTAPRAMAVLDPIKLTLVNVEEGFCEQLDFEILPSEQPKTRKICFSKNLYIEREDFKINPPPKYHRLVPNGFVRLKSAYIIECVDYKVDENGEVEEVFARLIKDSKSGNDTSGVKVKGVIHWVNAFDAIDMRVHNLEDLVLEGEGAALDRINTDSLKVYNAKCEPYLKGALAGEGFQFLRQGYYCKDSKNSGVFNLIAGLKDSYKPKK